MLLRKRSKKTTSPYAPLGTKAHDNDDDEMITMMMTVLRMIITLIIINMMMITTLIIINMMMITTLIIINMMMITTLIIINMMMMIIMKTIMTTMIMLRANKFHSRLNLINLFHDGVILRC